MFPPQTILSMYDNALKKSNVAMYNTSMLQQCVQCLLNAIELFIVSPIKPWKEKKVFTINNKQYILYILC